MASSLSRSRAETRTSTRGGPRRVETDYIENRAQRAAFERWSLISRADRLMEKNDPACVIDPRYLLVSCYSVAYHRPRAVEAVMAAHLQRTGDRATLSLQRG